MSTGLVFIQSVDTISTVYRHLYNLDFTIFGYYYQSTITGQLQTHFYIVDLFQSKVPSWYQPTQVFADLSTNPEIAKIYTLPFTSSSLNLIHFHLYLLHLDSPTSLDVIISNINSLLQSALPQSLDDSLDSSDDNFTNQEEEKWVNMDLIYWVERETELLARLTRMGQKLGYVRREEFWLSREMFSKLQLVYLQKEKTRINEIILKEWLKQQVDIFFIETNKIPIIEEENKRDLEREINLLQDEIYGWRQKIASLENGVVIDLNRLIEQTNRLGQRQIPLLSGNYSIPLVGYVCDETKMMPLQFQNGHCDIITSRGFNLNLYNRDELYEILMALDVSADIQHFEELRLQLAEKIIALDHH